MIDDLLRGRGKRQREFLAGEREFLKRLASEGQSPDAVFVGCSDSRVVPELLTAASPGEIFVIRNVANLVPPFEHADASVGAALEYAVAHLKVPHVVVCGHYGCGGVHAALAGESFDELESLGEWLEGLRPAIDRTDPSLGADARWRAAVEQNVVLQLDNLPTYPVVAEALRRGELSLHGWVYDLHTHSLRVHDAPSGAFCSVDKMLGETVDPDETEIEELRRELAEKEAFKASCDVEALIVLRKLGPVAAPAAPSVLRYLGKSSASENAVVAVIRAIGPAALPALQELARSRSKAIRERAEAVRKKLEPAGAARGKR
jgi:carbonic anhydrase